MAQRNMVISIGLVILVVFIFLRSGWSTFIPSMSVPVSIIATFGAMYLLGYTLDNLSLMALTIATGFVVDDAIVVIENITRHIEGGMKPMQAALKGAEEIGFTVLSMSVSLIAVFIPILMMSGMVGRLFREFAVVLSVAIAVSMVVSLTVTPMMCAWLLKEQQRPRLPLQPDRKILPVDHLHLCVGARRRAGSSRVRPADRVADDGRQRLPLRQGSEGIFPAAGYRASAGQRRGRAAHLLSGAGGKAKWFEEQVRTDPDVETVDHGGGHQRRRVRRRTRRRSTCS